MPLPPPVLALSPGNLQPQDLDDFRRRVGAAIDAGLRGLLLREKALEDGVLFSLAAQLRDMLRAQGAWLGIHDRVHLALVCGADGVHLGFQSLPLEVVRTLTAGNLCIGLSTHADDEPSHWEGSDYLFHGPFGDTPSKHGLLKPVGEEGMLRARQATGIPIWALGGVHPEHVAGLRRCNLNGVAALGGILSHPDPAGRFRAYQDAWEAS